MWALTSRSVFLGSIAIVLVGVAFQAAATHGGPHRTDGAPTPRIAPQPTPSIPASAPSVSPQPPLTVAPRSSSSSSNSNCLATQVQCNKSCGKDYSCPLRCMQQANKCIDREGKDDDDD
jgi:hypothetical protein